MIALNNDKHILTILRVAIPSPLRQYFDYLAPENYDISQLQFGLRVLVPFGAREVVGFILEIVDETNIDSSKLKRVLTILDDQPLWSAPLLELIKWTSNYYHHSIGDILHQILPSRMRSESDLEQFESDEEEITAIATTESLKAVEKMRLQLNDFQLRAVEAIKNAANFQSFLLDGVTGSGKTEVYLQVIEEIIAAGKQALILVPEINLTPQTVARFQQRFASSPTAVIHSRLNTTERLNAWLAAKNGNAAIVIGTRSAIFTPLKNPGILIIDEEHDSSFKQQSSLRYSARDLAVMRGKLENIPVVLGSATPSLETLHQAQVRQRYKHLVLPNRAGDAVQPRFNIVDMRNQKITDGLAAGLIQAIDGHLEKEGQVLLFLNRRGYAPLLLCNSCGWVADCKHCSVHLTFHRQEQQLHCHHCGAIYPVPKICVKCGKTSLFALGVGTEKLETSLKKMFPGVAVLRVDKDTTRHKGSMQKMLKSIHDQECQILVGTQMLSKGHHFPNVTMSAILNIDNGLFSPDFRASEHLAQLIIQVAGRAGREERRGEVYLQTHHPHHPLLRKLIDEGYNSFANFALMERQAAQLPPLSYLALFRVEAKDKNAAHQFLKQLREQGEKTALPDVQIFGPLTSPLERKAGYHRMQLLLQSKGRNTLQSLLSSLVTYIATQPLSRKVKWSLDVDPGEMV